MRVTLVPSGRVSSHLVAVLSGIDFIVVSCLVVSVVGCQSLCIRALLLHPHALALSTHTPTPTVCVGIGRRKAMTMDTGLLASIASRITLATHDVDLVTYQLYVLRVHAAPHTTRMVANLVRWDISDFLLVHNSVSSL